MASATVLIRQQTQTPDLSPLTDQKIPLQQVQVKNRDEDSECFNRVVLPSASGPVGGRYTNSSRSRKSKNGMKKQPQRGLGVAQLEKLRLQEESRQEQASCLAYAHMPIPLDSSSSSFLRLQGVRGPGGAYNGLSPKLTGAASIELSAEKTSPFPASTILKGWGTGLPATSMALLRSTQDAGNSTNPYPSGYCADRKPVEAGRFELGIEQVCSPPSSTVLRKSPFLLSKATQRVFAETEGYTRTLKPSVDVNPIEQHKKVAGSSSNVKLYSTTMGSAGALNNKMAFVDLNAMESVNYDASSPPLRTTQLLPFQDGRHSVNGDSSKELSSFQNHTYQTAWCQTDKIPGKKRSRDSTQKNSSTSPRSLALALSVVPSESGQIEDGARFRTEIQRNAGALASTDNSSFLNLKKQEMSVCSPGHEDQCRKGDCITTKNDFLALSLSSSRFSTEKGRKQEVHEDSVQESNNEPHKCSKTLWFNAFHQKDIANDAESKQHLSCQKTMGECETRRFPSRETPSKKLLVAARSTHHDSENNVQRFGTNVSISVLNVMTSEQQDPSKHTQADAEQIIRLPKNSQLNLSLGLSL